MPERPTRIVRLFTDQALDGDRASLDDRSANYLGRTLRLKTGAQLLLFDGKGLEREAKIVELRRDRVQVTLGDVRQPVPSSPLHITLIQGVAKGDAMDFAVQKATELGVAEIHPALTAHSVVRLNGERAARRRKHWQGVAISACEQSGRHTPPIITEPRPLAQVLKTLPAGGARLVLDPAGEASLLAATPPETPRIRLLLGPEGGLSDEDLGLATKADFKRAHLGPRVLRVETAAVTACGLLQSARGDLSIRPPGRRDDSPELPDRESGGIH